MTTANKWSKWMKIDADFARRRLIEAGQVSPLFVIHAYDSPEPIMIPAGWASEMEKQVAQAVIATLAVAHDAEAISFITEAWMRSVKRADRESQDEFKDRVYAVPAREAEDRQEVLMVSICYRTADNERKSLIDIRGIERDASGIACDTKPFPLPSDMPDMSGTMADLLLPERPSLSEREHAKKLLDDHGIKPQVWS